MVVYAGHYGIYYDIDEPALRVNVAYIEDQRTDPAKRFEAYTVLPELAHWWKAQAITR